MISSFYILGWFPSIVALLGNALVIVLSPLRRGGGRGGARTLDVYNFFNQKKIGDFS